MPVNDHTSLVLIHYSSLTDTLQGISIKYGVEMSLLKQANRIWRDVDVCLKKFLFIPLDPLVLKTNKNMIYQPLNSTSSASGTEEFLLETFGSIEKDNIDMNSLSRNQLSTYKPQQLLQQIHQIVNNDIQEQLLLKERKAQFTICGYCLDGDFARILGHVPMKYLGYFQSTNPRPPSRAEILNIEQSLNEYKRWLPNDNTKDHSFVNQHDVYGSETFSNYGHLDSFYDILFSIFTSLQSCIFKGKDLGDEIELRKKNV